MKRSLALAALAAAALFSQAPPPGTVLANTATATWTREAADPPGAESVVLREDPKTGAVELLVRYPAGHVFRPHWHSANERIVLLEGRLALRYGDAERFLEAGGYAFLPAREVQRLACVSETRCAFYVHWDSKLDFNAAPAGK